MQKTLLRYEQYLEVCAQLVGWGMNSLEFAFLSDMCSLVKSNHSCLEKNLKLKNILVFCIQLEAEELWQKSYETEFFPLKRKR